MIAQGRGHKQISARVHRKSVEELYRMLAEEKMSFNRFIDICVGAYIKSDPRMRGIVESARRDDAVSKKEAKDKRFSFDDVERQELLREIEMSSPDVDDD